MTLELLDFLAFTYPSQVLTQNIIKPLSGVLFQLFKMTKSADIRQKIADLIFSWSQRERGLENLKEELIERGYKGNSASIYANMREERQGPPSNSQFGGFNFGDRQNAAKKVSKPPGVQKIESDLETLEYKIAHVEKNEKLGNRNQEHIELLESLKATKPKIKLLIEKLQETPFDDVLEFAEEIAKRLDKLSQSKSQNSSSFDNFGGFNFGREEKDQNQEKFDFGWGSSVNKPKSNSNKIDVALTDNSSFNKAFSANDGNFFSDIQKQTSNKNQKSDFDFNFGTNTSEKQTGNNWTTHEVNNKPSNPNDFWGNQENTFSFSTSQSQKTSQSTKPQTASNDFWGSSKEFPKTNQSQSKPTKKNDIWGDSSDDDDQGAGKLPLHDPFKEMEENQSQTDQAYFGGKFGGGVDFENNGKLPSPKPSPGKDRDPFSTFSFEVQQPRSDNKQISTHLSKEPEMDLLGVGDTANATQVSQPSFSNSIQQSPSLNNANFDLFQLDGQPKPPTTTSPPVQQATPSQPKQVSNYDLLLGTTPAQQIPNPMMTGTFMGMNPQAIYGAGTQIPAMMNPMMMANPGLMMGQQPMMMPGMQPVYFMQSPTGSPMMMRGPVSLNPNLGMGIGPQMGGAAFGIQPSITSPIQGANLGASNNIKFDAPQKKPDILDNSTVTDKKDSNTPFGDLHIDLI